MHKALIAAGALVLICTGALAQTQRGQFRNLEQADTNHDGIITRDEFISGRAEQFARLDRNDDGVLDGSDGRRRMNQEEQSRLRHADANGDGKVTKDEFVSAPTPVFDRADSDNNGSLDQAEIAAAKEQVKERVRDRRRAQ